MLKEARHLSSSLILPDRDLSRIHLKLFGQLMKLVHPLHCLYDYFGLKLYAILFLLLWY